MKVDSSRRVGRILRNARAHAGITRAEMARCLGWSESYLQVIEDGSQTSGLYAINHYAKALCIDLKALVN